MRFLSQAEPAKVNWPADFRAVKRPCNVLPRRHLPTAFQPPATSLRFLALQRFRPGRSTLRGFYRPALVRPQGLATLSADYSRPNLAGLVSCRLRSWAWPFRGCSRWRWSRPSGRSGPTGGCKAVRWSVQARPYGGLVRLSALTRPRARRPTAESYSATGLAPLLGFSSLGVVL